MVAVGRWKRRGDRVVALRRGVESSVCRRDSGAAVTVVVGGTLGRVIGWCVRGRRHVMDGMGRGTLGQSGGGLQINGGLIFDFLGGGGGIRHESALRKSSASTERGHAGLRRCRVSRSWPDTYRAGAAVSYLVDTLRRVSMIDVNFLLHGGIGLLFRDLPGGRIKEPKESPLRSSEKKRKNNTTTGRQIRRQQLRPAPAYPDTSCSPTSHLPPPGTEPNDWVTRWKLLFACMRVSSCTCDRHWAGFWRGGE